MGLEHLKFEIWNWEFTFCFVFFVVVVVNNWSTWYRLDFFCFINFQFVIFEHLDLWWCSLYWQMIMDSIWIFRFILILLSNNFRRIINGYKLSTKQVLTDSCSSTMSYPFWTDWESCVCCCSIRDLIRTTTTNMELSRHTVHFRSSFRVPSVCQLKLDCNLETSVDSFGRGGKWKINEKQIIIIIK